MRILSVVGFGTGTLPQRPPRTGAVKSRPHLVHGSAMPFFARTHYTSDATDFINGLKAANPSLEAEQLAGRALLWDKNVDRSSWREYRDGQVAQKPYVYQSTSGNDSDSDADDAR
jgi:hypothetical protein